MLRSQGPINTSQTTHLNPIDCYVRSYDCNQKLNVNASFNTVGLLIREKRKKLVTEIASLLGDYSGDWYVPSLRPRNLPLHPLDWSSTLLLQLREFVQFLPRNSTIEQRLVLAHQAMLGGRCHTDGPENSAESANMADPDTRSYTDETSSINGQDIEIELLRAEKEGLLDQIQAMREELDLYVKERFQLQDQTVALEKANEELSACKQELSELQVENAWLQRDKALVSIGCEQWYRSTRNHLAFLELSAHCPNTRRRAQGNRGA